MKKLVFAGFLFVCLSQANASYFSAPKSMKFTNLCLWVEEGSRGALKSFSSGHCESNVDRVTGARFYRNGKKECVATTGKRLVVTDERGKNRYQKVYKITKPVVACFDPK